ncbi:hypothetical protein DC366_14105 [Pelagivirga sediminicola]|uniref:Uncharacterized protein n=1 Tax=Pelagivirga sediminicola TaxID=2170575 RepID=A0A2T7G518_9RHOB|nr:hypothetical protein DC366_14105 [Pelagivirga sediminicola]
MQTGLEWAIRKVASTHDLDDVKRRWLDQIGKEMTSQVVIDRKALTTRLSHNRAVILDEIKAEA